MKKYKGFTLIEILIVLVVIGILSSMMVIASNESTTTAKASNIVSNLRNFSMAAMAYYTDNVDHLTSDSDLTKNVKKYLHNEGDIPDKDENKEIKYHVIRDDQNTWWAMYDFGSTADSRVQEKLSGRAESANLLGTKTNTPPTTESTYKSERYVWLKIRSSKKK